MPNVDNENIATIVAVVLLASNAIAVYEEGGVCVVGSNEYLDGDCTKYLECVHGRYMARPCPSGLHWNDVIKTCDWPHNAKCQRCRLGDPGCSLQIMSTPKWKLLLVNNPPICNSGEVADENYKCVSSW